MTEFFNNWLKSSREFLLPAEDLAARRKIKLYLVGGALRDILLKKEKLNPDFDFCLKKGAINFARRLASEIRAGFVVLDEEHGCARVVRKSRGRIITLDFSDFRGKTLEEDLLYRDFTVNSMAILLGDILEGASFAKALIDPHGGARDLAAKTLRMVHKRSFEDDPLRIMRAFSLSAIFGFQIGPKVSKEIFLKKNRLKTVSFERIRDELFKILSSPQSWEIIASLDKHDILEMIFPEIRAMKKNKLPAFRRLNVWGHTMLTLKNIESLMVRFGLRPEIKEYLDGEISSGRKRSSLLKLAALLHDIGKPRTFRRDKGKIRFHGHERLGASMAGAVACRLKLSNEETRFLKKAVFMHLRPGYLVTNPALSAKARFRFFRDAGEAAAGILILALADERATKGYLLLERSRRRYESLIPRLLKEYFAGPRKVSPVRLADGNDIMSHCKLSPSPLIGKILKELEELQALGRIRTKEEALKAAKRIIKNT